MTAHRCRFVAPCTSDWSTVEADGPELAANEFHSRNCAAYSSTYTPDPERATQVHFALVEIEGHGEVISRVYTSGIARRGGVPGRRQRFGPTLAEVARAVGWDGDPQELLEDGWDGEEVRP